MNETLSKDLDRFKTVVDAYGARESTWPEADLPHMRRLLATSDVARSLLRQEEKFDFLLHEESTGARASSALLGRVLADAEAANRGPLFKIFWPFGAIWKPASGLVMAACLGIVIGFASPNIIGNSDDLSLDEPSFTGATMYDLELTNDTL
ncbi:MAG: hypothetical protein EP348_05895 [Alphaproteobacteria bacterium]|nr:MAG: hypothetical protein EP348_05895 [Alphaproteobacteria bacterium]